MDTVALSAAKNYADRHIPTFLYNSKSGLIDFRIGLSERSIKPCNIYCIGDSITRGERSSDEPYKSWAGVLRTALQSKYGDAGEGWINTFESTLPTAAKPRVTFGTGWVMAPGSKSGFGGCYANSNGATTDMSVSFNGDRATIVYVKNPAFGSANIKIDGVSVGTLNCNGTVVSFNNYQTFMATAAGAHVLTITPASTTQIGIEGIFAELGTSGVRVHRIGMSGYRSTDWINTNTQAAWAGLPPSLAILALGINDAWMTVGVTAYKANMETLIQTFLTVNSSVLLLVLYTPNTDVTTIWADYVKVQYDLSKKYNIALIDMNAAWGKSWTFAQSRGLFGAATLSWTGESGTNNAHPSDKGHRYIAGVIEKCLV